MGRAAAEPLETDLREAAEERYLSYALSVITSRALPDARDGLKPVQRRILYAMYQNLRLTAGARPRKSAAIVGEVLGKYHPHGDQAAYEAMVRMAQPFSLRYPLVHGEGNFGSLDGDNAAAYRYTEARLTPLAEEMLADLGAETVPLRATFDAMLEEPTVLPSAIPQLLMNGSTGIAVGMATNIPPHNLSEVVAALTAMIDEPDLDVKGLLKHVKGPDFPTGGEILNTKKELRDIYESGQGAIRLRAQYRVESLPRGKRQIVVTSIPYTVNKSELVLHIGEEILARKLPQVLDVRDESSADAARQLMAAFKLDQVQADAILDIRLYQLARLEIEKILAERAEKKKRLKEIEALLARPRERWKMIRAELAALGEKYGDKRRTQLSAGEELAYDPEAYIVHEDATVILSRDGWLKRVREVKDPSSTRLREGDALAAVLPGTTRDRLVLFSTRGTLYVLRVADVPATTGYGEPVQSLLKFGDGERVVAAQLLREDGGGEAQPALPGLEKTAVLVATANGYGFRTTPDLSETTRAGRRVARVGEGDEIVSIEPVTGPTVVVATRRGKMLRFPLDEVAELSGPGRGVILMRPSKEGDDRIVGALALPKQAGFLALTPEGTERRFDVSDVPAGKRAGKGQKVVKRGGVAALKRLDEGG